MVFESRQSAGNILAQQLAVSHKGKIALVLGLARGGVSVAFPIAKQLGAPLDVLIVKKIPSPGEKELGIGALAWDNVWRVDWKLAHRMGADEAYVNKEISRLASEIADRTRLYRRGKGALEVKGKTILLVDDGAATGATMATAVLWARKKQAKQIVVALPVAHADVVSALKPEVDELHILEIRSDLGAVGQFYEEFHQLSDDEVVQLLNG